MGDSILIDSTPLLVLVLTRKLTNRQWHSDARATHGTAVLHNGGWQAAAEMSLARLSG